MPPVFTDNMVLQRNRKIPVWGESSKEVTVTFKGKEYKTSPVDGFFRLDLDETDAECGLMLAIKTDDCEIIYNNVAVGEVWIAGGQSNMEMMLRNTTNGMLDTQFQDFGDNIRYFAPPRKNSATGEYETKNSKSEWINVSDDEGFISAVGYYFAQRLYQKLQVPVGIIDCNRGSSSVFHWIPKSVSQKNEITAPYVFAYDSYLSGNYIPGHEYKVMGAAIGEEYGYFYENQFKAVCPYGVGGVIWYQGEADAAGEESALIYRTAFKMLLDTWRSKLENPNLTFITVLLAGYGGDWIGYSMGRSWAYMREAQMDIALTEENVYFVSALDRGFENNIHPSEKKLVGERLAACALSEVYGLDIKWKCPTLKNVEIQKDKIIIYLNNTYGRLYADCGESKDITVRNFLKYSQKYTSKIVDDHIEVDISDVKPVEICHCFENSPYVRIFNRYGLPLVPWRYISKN